MHIMRQKIRNQLLVYRSGDRSKEAGAAHLTEQSAEPFIAEELLDAEMRIISLVQLSEHLDTGLAVCGPDCTGGMVYSNTISYAHCQDAIDDIGHPDASPGACYTEHDFIMRTGIIPRYDKGELTIDNEMVIRFVDRIFIEEHSLKVIFRAGISIEVHE